MHRHQRAEYYIVNEGVYGHDRGVPTCTTPSTREEVRRFRFSRLVAHGANGGGSDAGLLPRELAERLATAMTAQTSADGGPQRDSEIPAGYTYLGQAVDHDLTLDRTTRSLGTDVSVDELLQGRSPSLDLDALYGLGPAHPDSARFFESDGVRLRMGRTSAVPDMPELQGFDLPRRPSSADEPGTALIPDHRNDENLAVAQIHLAFIRFHNKVVGDLPGAGTPSITLFETARAQVVKHYQWMLRHDYLPRIVDPDIVDDVFTHGRRFFEVPFYPGSPDPYACARPGDTPTMPVEFSIAAFRFGHSMVRGGYEWNVVFNSDVVQDNPRHLAPATLAQLFRFSGTGGALTVDNPLPSNWIADWRRLFDLVKDGGAGPDLAPPAGGVNVAKRIDTLLVNPLRLLPPGTFGAAPGTAVDDIERNLAFRNLMRANMVRLASGQDTAEFMKIEPLSETGILDGDGGANLAGLPQEDKDRLVAHTPLWFYILREAELNGGRLTGVGGRIVAEVFHRAMEGSTHSIVTDPAWRPGLAGPDGSFGMAHLLLYAFEGNPALLNPVG